MERIALVTDSSSSITVKTADNYGVYLLKMPVIVENNEYFEDINLSYEQFTDMLRNGKLPKTSQPSLGEAEELFDKLVKEYDYILVLPIMKSLSSTYEMLKELAKKYQNKIYVADHRAVSGNLLYEIIKVKKKISDGQTFSELINYLETHKNPSHTYLVPKDIGHLRRTGRAKVLSSIVAGLLNICPILELYGEEKFIVFAKVRGFKKALKEVVQFHLKDGVSAKTHVFYIMQSDNMEDANFAKEEIIKVFGEQSEIVICPISPVIASHTGLGTVSISANTKE